MYMRILRVSAKRLQRYIKQLYEWIFKRWLSSKRAVATATRHPHMLTGGSVTYFHVNSWVTQGAVLLYSRVGVVV